MVNLGSFANGWWVSSCAVHMAHAWCSHPPPPQATVPFGFATVKFVLQKRAMPRFVLSFDSLPFLVGSLQKCPPFQRGQRLPSFCC